MFKPKIGEFHKTEGYKAKLATLSEEVTDVITIDIFDKKDIKEIEKVINILTGRCMLITFLRLFEQVKCLTII